MSRTKRPALLLFVLVALAILQVLVGRAQQPPSQAAPPPQQKPTDPQAEGQQNRQPVFRLPINFVRVDVIVTGKQGQPITDLKPEDFEVAENGKPQKVESCKLRNIGNAQTQQLTDADPVREIRSDADEEAEAARDDVRIFAIFLDDYHVRKGNSMGVRAPLERFLQTQLGPRDLVEIMYPLTPTTALVLSADHEKIARAIESFEGRKYDYRPRNDIEEQYSNYPAETVEQIRNAVSLSALKGLVTHLGTLSEKRKTVIAVTEGYTNNLPPQLRDPIASMPGLGNPARNNPNAGDTMPEQSAAFFNTASMMSDLRNVYDAANRANTAIYTLDPRGLATGEFDLSQPAISQKTDRQALDSTLDSLRILADNTDGRAIINRNDLTAGLKQVIQDSSAYYLLGYNSTFTAPDGRFHEIKVRVKRPGVQIRARKGYWAPTEEDRAKALAPPKPAAPPAVTKALSAVVETAHGRSIRTWVGTSRGDNGKTRVTFVWEPIPQAAGGAAADRPTRVALTASGASGEAYFRGRVPDGEGSTPGVRPAANQPTATATGTSPAKVVFDVPPGRLQLRMSVQGAAEQVLDSDLRELDVPDLTAPQVTLTTPAVYSARTAREFRALASDPNAVPTPDREFSRTERLLIRFGVYGPGSSAPTVTAHLLNRTGQEMSTLPVQVIAGPQQEQTIDLPLAGLAAGEYVIEIKAKGESGESSQMVGIRVTA